jgi:hypothetical protein
MRRSAAALAAIALVAAACTARPEGAASPAPSFDVLPAAQTGERLLVLTDDGRILVTDPDGEHAVTIRPESDLSIEARQPVWSPDGTTVAWAEVPTGGPAGASDLVLSRPDGSAQTSVRVDAGMFFLQWDPTSKRLAYLGSFQNSIGMGVAELGEDGEAEARTLGQGQPFYVSWSPEGDRLLIHVGSRTLGRIDLEGQLDDVGEVPAIFQAPVWLADGRLVYARGPATRQELVVREGRRSTALVRYRGAIEFVVSPGGDRIAYRVDDGDGFGTVSVVTIGSGRSRAVSDEPASAFHWSPDGRRLLLMTPEPGEDPTTHRWWVWDGEEAAPIGPSFAPSPTYLREYLPFFGQYAQAMTLWSPDGSSFAYPGLIEDRDGIWVQRLDEADPALVVEGGSVVAWSPVEL